MVNTDTLKNIHLEFIEWLRTQERGYAIEDYIKYVKEQLRVYEFYSKHGNFDMLEAAIPRGLSRYLDEFSIDLDFSQTAQTHFDKMSEEVNKLRNKIDT